MDTTDLECLLAGKRRKQSAEASCEHRLSGSRWTDEKQVMAARGGNLECAARNDLSLDARKVRTPI
jgi:hypothetical protein